MSGIHFGISKLLKTSFSKWPIANACKDSKQSQQTLQVIAEYFPNEIFAIYPVCLINDLWVAYILFSFLSSMGSQWRCITILVGISK